MPDLDAFIDRWKVAGGTELANYQLFLTDLAVLLDLPCPEPATGDARTDAYVFERPVRFVHGDGTESAGRIDLYRRGSFVLEAKKLRQTATKGFDDALMRARGQAESYARSLPSDEGRPPFLVVVDVGNVIQLYSDFTRSGATYTPFPDPRSHQIRLDQLRDDTVRQRLRQVWLDPMALDPSRQAAKVTRVIARQLADIAMQLEEAGHPAEAVAGFLTRCLFTFFAEDVELIPKRSFGTLLDSLIKEPTHFVPMVQDLWTTMDRGGLSIALQKVLPQFNGKLFKDQTVLPLNRAQIELLREAAKADWQFVEPAIFGTLLERALDPRERHALGAHYTPRAYVERLVIPTVVEPLRDDWRDVQTAVLTLANEGKDKEARAEVRAFLPTLCTV
ncbi:MAG: class I SAM-dependent DNA methyltransferase, partial [Acidobacteria bacterium]|nr:class I SAM-dependent DNA methyltransferase [Acidobacteriota bacterium]